MIASRPVFGVFEDSEGMIWIGHHQGAVAAAEAAAPDGGRQAERRGEPMGELPCPRSTVADFKHIIGWHELEQRQAHYELGKPAA